MITRDQAFDLLEGALSAADADSVSASISGGTVASTRIADNAATQCIHRTDYSLHVTCAYGKSHASASSNTLDPDTIRATVARAQEAARLSPPDPEFMPPLEASEAQRYLPVDAWCETTAARAPEATAAEMAAAIAPVAAQGYRLSGAYRHQATMVAFVNSNGLRGTHQGTQASFRATCLGADGTGWAQATAMSATGINPTAVAGEALCIAMDAQKPTAIEPGKYTVILRPAAVEEMLPWYMVCDAKATDEGRTFLRGRLGTKVCNESITLRSDPTDPRCPDAPMLGGGLAAEPVTWVRNGVLENLHRSRFWAQKTNTQPSRGPTNLILDGGNTSVEEMIASTERGILVTRFWYIRIVDPMTSLLTGMTRDGLFLIENGQITRPLKQLRFNEKVLNVLSNVEQIGPVERLGDSLMPTLKVRDFTFSSGTTF